MNAAIRAVVRTGLHLGYDVVGIHEGYKGLLSANCRLLTARDVGGIIQQGGTILGSARCPSITISSIAAQVQEGLDHIVYGRN